MKIALTLIGIIVVLVGTTTMSHRTVDGQTKQERLSAHIAWVLANGDKVFQGAETAQALGLGDGSVKPAVFQMAFQKKDATLAHAFEVVKDSDPVVVLIIWKNTDHGIGWRTSKAGDIIKTVRVEYTDNSSRIVPNAEYADLFAEELKYWDRHLPEKYKLPQR